MIHPLKKCLALGSLLAGCAVTTTVQAAAYTYEFKTFFDTSTTDNVVDTKTLNYSVATLQVSDVSGGVVLTLKQNTSAFPALMTSGTFVEALWLNASSGGVNSLSGIGLTSSSGYVSSGLTQDAGYTYKWNLDFQDGTFSEGSSTSVQLTGAGITADSIVAAKAPIMLDLANVGGVYGSAANSHVHFVVGKAVAAVPEPGTAVLMGLGVFAMAGLKRRRA
ncbi:MAG: PEP-CTERM sorting domain-containing protein [Aquabacterium sp.]|uniref:PEP-CTERM sorting domain-containing protein n=1 Tax=Aquabacterium sp. TaxID=1872578 RepID=UPI003BC47C27